jgi:bifunctional UDP-N-acetylglucosamine pyrophosphorylase/glucosamine-1-phosphate N-acetyltransferase
MTAELDNPHGYGRIVRRNNNEVASIVEHRDATTDVLKIREINSGIYIFNAPALFQSLTKIRTDNAQREYYLPDVIGISCRAKAKSRRLQDRYAVRCIGYQHQTGIGRSGSGHAR